MYNDSAVLAPIAPPSAAVSAFDLIRRYGDGDSAVEALRGVSLEVPAGQFPAIMGPSGSGKSTLMHLMAGLDRPTAGSVGVAGQDLTTMNDKELTLLRRKHIGFVFQAFNLVPTLTAEENVTLPLSIAGKKSTAPGWIRCFSVSASTTGARTGRRSCRVVSSSAWPLPRPRDRAGRAVRGRAHREPGLAHERRGARAAARAANMYGQTIVMVTHDEGAAEAADRVIHFVDGRAEELS